MVALAVGLGAPTTRTEGAGAPARPAKPPVALLFHGGGFVFGSPEAMRTPVRLARRAGFEPVAVRYPLGDLPAAVGKAQRAARHHRRRGRTVVAYGESAGGTLAALLAQRGMVTGAAGYAPLADLVEFARRMEDPEAYQAAIQASDRQLRKNSPIRHRSARPTLALLGRRDSAYLKRDGRRWARRDDEVRAITVAGGHPGSFGRPARPYLRNVRRAYRWLARRADRD